MATNVEIQKKKSENNMSVIKRFTRRVQEAGILPKVRSGRWLTRTPSPYKKKIARLHNINRKAEILELIKLGKMPEGRQRKRRR